VAFGGAKTGYLLRGRGKKERFPFQVPRPEVAREEGGKKPERGRVAGPSKKRKKKAAGRRGKREPLPFMGEKDKINFPSPEHRLVPRKRVSALPRRGKRLCFALGGGKGKKEKGGKTCLVHVPEEKISCLKREKKLLALKKKKREV